MNLIFTLKFLLGFFGFFLLWIVFLYFMQNKMVYFPPELSAIDFSIIKGFEQQEVETADGLKIKGYYLAPQKSKPIILEFHGNASHPAWEAAKFRDLVNNEGYGLLLAEYRGYGGNPGTPSETNLYLDGNAYLNWIKSNPELKDNPIVVYGASIGSGVAVDVAKHHPVISALILEVTFDKLSSVGAYHYPYIPFAEKLMKNKFPNVDKIKDVKMPILFLLAGKDNVAPIKFGQALADAANEPKIIHVFPQADHINIYNHGAGKVVDDFLKKHFP